jgi:hypothetical protein
MIFTERKVCIICKSALLNDIFDVNYTFPIGNFTVNSPDHECYFIPYNVQICGVCKTVQTKYLGDLNLIYENNFAGSFGTIRTTLNNKFADFILENDEINGIIEIGAGNGSLSESILDKRSFIYNIIDPSYSGPKINRIVHDCYFEDFQKETTINTIIMSQVFEHFYDPVNIIEKIKSLSTIDYIYISWPNLESFIKNGVYHVLNPEHIYYIENQFLIDLFKYFNYTLGRVYYHTTHSVFFEFKKESFQTENQIFPTNKNTANDTKLFFSRILNNIQEANTLIRKTSDPVYIWPCSMHTLFCLSLGLESNLILNVLDNSTFKIGRYLYGFKHKCIEFTKTTTTPDKKIIVITGGCYNSEIIDDLSKNTSNTIVIL